MTPHYLARQLRAISEQLRAKAGKYPVSLAELSDDEIIDLWNDTDAYSDQEKLTPQQLQIAIARSETVSDFLKCCRCPALVDGSYLLFRPSQSAVLRTLHDKRYFMPPRFVDEITAIAAGDSDDMYPTWKRLIRRECRSFIREHHVADFDILVSYYYWADS